MSTNKLHKSLEETERMIDKMIDKLNQVDPKDTSDYKVSGFTLQLIDRAVKLSDTKMRFEAMRQRISPFELVDNNKKQLKQS